MKQSKQWIDFEKKYSFVERYSKFYWGIGIPEKKDMQIFTKFFKQSLKNQKLKKAKVLILGSTPKMRDLAAKFNSDITLIDVSKEIIKGMTKLIKHKKKERKIQGNWFKTPFKDNEFDIILGDLVLGNVGAKDLNRFLKEVNRVLKPDGEWIHRIFFVPDKWKYEPIDNTLKKFEKWKDRKKALEPYLFFNTYDPKTHLVSTSKIGKWFSKYWTGKGYNYPDKKVNWCMEELYKTFSPYEKTWHCGTKKETWKWLSKYFKVIKEEQPNDHRLAYTFPIIVCRKN
ncbi:class I SAM-dependent methyltransferase [Candidatus Woesearchaeota archaeon]|nr:class I SAM-dependent methyltransferase [Candidatus Woesearchaeota archaeon]